LAAKAGAAFISPFVGRLDDIGQDGMSLIGEIAEIYSNYDFQTEILVASVRSPQHVVDAARIGADVCTLPPGVIWQLFKHPLTDKGLEAFLKDWEKTGHVHAVVWLSGGGARRPFADILASRPAFSARQ